MFFDFFKEASHVSGGPAAPVVGRGRDATQESEQSHQYQEPQTLHGSQEMAGVYTQTLILD